MIFGLTITEKCDCLAFLLMDSVARIDLAKDLSAFVNLATLLTTHFWKIKITHPRSRYKS